ncbi:putative transcription factor & chromatin remodeling CW-Zn family [Helianthus annuus]|nr:putative transcription factor & chromatin remodeling CW-Zn family [Helianthus annuus]
MHQEIMQPSVTVRVTGSHQDMITGFDPPRKRKQQNNISDNVIELSSSDSEDDENTPSCNNNHHQQLVLYDPGVSSPDEDFPVPISYKPPPPVKRILPSVGAFTVQCANCFKWRFIPTKQRYEEMREHITERPFVCATAQEWRPDVSCDDPPDIEPDGTRLWAIDKPNIVQPPPGWQRSLRIRGEGGTKFADMYLIKHPEYVEQGVTLAQFSFQVPKPLQENYVRKRSSSVPALQDGGFTRMPESFEPFPGIKMIFFCAWAGWMGWVTGQVGFFGLNWLC